MHGPHSISHRPELTYVPCKNRLIRTRAERSIDDAIAERAARVDRYAAQISRIESRRGRPLFDRRVPIGVAPAKRPLRAVTPDGSEVARFESVRDAARFAIDVGLTKSPVESVASTLRKAIRRGFASYGLRLVPIAA